MENEDLREKGWEAVIGLGAVRDFLKVASKDGAHISPFGAEMFHDIVVKGMEVLNDMQTEV